VTDIEPMVEAWADKIRTHLEAAERYARQTVQEIVAAGQALVDAKAALGHGSWLPLLDQVGVKPRMAQLFMAVARNPVTSDAQRVSYLPAAIGTLAVLARLDEDELIEAIENGELGPETTRPQAVAFVRRCGHARSRDPHPWLIPARQGRLRDPTTDVLLGIASRVARAEEYRGLYGVEFPDREAKALAQAEQALAAYRARWS
jgi:hypothetical protein